jgi:hypothetical protein
LVCSGDPERLDARVEAVGAVIVERSSLSLDEIFLAHSATRSMTAAEIHA